MKWLNYRTIFFFLYGYYPVLVIQCEYKAVTVIDVVDV